MWNKHLLECIHYDLKDIHMYFIYGHIEYVCVKYLYIEVNLIIFDSPG